MSYVEDACDDCGLRLPRKDLLPWTEEEVTGRETGTYQRFASGRTGYRQGKTTYRINHLHLCPGCYAKRVAAREAAAAANRRRLLTVLLIIGALVVAVATCSTIFRSSGTGDAAPTNQAPAANEAAAAPTVAANSAATMPDNAPETTATNDVQTESANDLIATPPPDVDAEPPVGSPLNVAINQALATGQATPWSDGSDSGVVSVGESRMWRGRLCRSYGFTTDGVRSSVVISCQAADGTWRPAGTYTNAVAVPG